MHLHPLCSNPTLFRVNGLFKLLIALLEVISVTSLHSCESLGSPEVSLRPICWGTSLHHCFSIFLGLYYIHSFFEMLFPWQLRHRQFSLHLDFLNSLKFLLFNPPPAQYSDLRGAEHLYRNSDNA